VKLELIYKMETLYEELLKEGYEPNFYIKRDVVIITAKVTPGDVEKIKSVLNYYRSIAGE